MDDAPSTSELLELIQKLQRRVEQLEAWREVADLTPRPRPAPAGTIPFPPSGATSHQGRKR